MPVADVEQGSLDALLAHRLPVDQRHSQRLRVQSQRGLEVLDGDANMVDGGQHRPEDM